MAARGPGHTHHPPHGGDPGWPSTLGALRELARHLDTHDTPVDYTRRRHLDYHRLLPPPTWTEICRHTGTIPGGDSRLRTARRWLFERLSGTPADLAPHPLTVQDPETRAQVAAFPRLLTPALVHALDDYTRAFLDEQHITDEPATWHQPTAMLDSLDLPGPDPARIDIDDCTTSSETSS
jgi:hypothetical protein